MLPNTDLELTDEDGIDEDNLAVDDEEQEQEPSLTYKIDFENKCLTGLIDGEDSIRQAVIKMINTELYADIIYAGEFGVESTDLIGQDRSYVMSEIQDRLEERLIEDDRISEVNDIEFQEVGKNKLSVSFTVVTDIGEIEMEGVEMNV